MTPEAIRTISQLRQRFYGLFAAAMKVPVTIPRENSPTSYLSMVSWTDSKERLNYVHVYAYTAPDELVPERPFILRVAVNKGGDMAMVAKFGSKQRLNRSRHFELTLLPEEILDFLPWIVSLAESYDKGSISFVAEPPHPFDLEASDVVSNNAWTHKAGSRFARKLLPLAGHASCLTTSQRNPSK